MSLNGIHRRKAWIGLVLWLCICLFIQPVYALVPATNEFFVADYLNVLSEPTKDKIMQVNINYNKQEEQPQVVVATVDNLEKMHILSYANQLFEKWQIGSAEHDNGILILLYIPKKDSQSNEVTSESDRSIQIEVGYGLEGALPDAKVGRIIDASLEYLSNDDYDQGLSTIFNQIAKEINVEYGYDDASIFDEYVSQAPQPLTEESTSSFRIIELILLIIIFIYIYRRPGGKRRYKRSGGFGGFPGGFGGGSSSGGFGGFSGGGGRSGGGGAGRSF